MKQKPMKVRILTTGIAVACVCALGICATGAGTTGDPLITLSYLTGIFRDGVIDDVTAATSSAKNDIQKTVATHAKALETAVKDMESPAVQNDFIVKNLKPGDSMTVKTGTEILWLSGSGTVDCSVLTDTTGGGKISAGGTLVANHLYVSTGSGTITVGDAVQCLIK